MQQSINQCGDQACFQQPVSMNQCLFPQPECENPRDINCGPVLSTTESQDWKGMPGCRRCKFLHCKCGLCRQCRVYEFVSSVSTEAPPPAANCTFTTIGMQICSPSKSKRKKKPYKKPAKEGPPIMSEYRAEYYPKRGEPANRKNFEPEAPKISNEISSRPPWTTFFKAKSSPFLESLSAEEAKLRELDRLLAMERENFLNDDLATVSMDKPQWTNDFNSNPTKPTDDTASAPPSTTMSSKPNSDKKSKAGKPPAPASE